MIFLRAFLSTGLGLLAASPLFAQRGDAPGAKLKTPAEERALFHVLPGFEVQLVAAEPDIQKPLNLAFDSAGRVWVTGSTLYPWPARRDALGQPIASFDKNWDENNLAFRAAATPPPPSEQGLDSVRILSDFGPDGRARRSTVFAEGLNIPIGVQPLPRAPGAMGDTVLLFSIPAIWRLTDTDGDGRADQREKLYDGFGFKDTHGMSSSYWLWFDGWVYGTHGFANKSDVVDRQGRTVTLTSGNTYRFRPDGSRFEVFVHGQTNPFGLAFDARGDLYTADSHSKPVYLLQPGGFYEGINREHDGLGFAPPITTDDHGSSAIAGIAHYSAAHFPVEFRDNLFNGNPVTRRINRTRLDWRGSSPTAARQPDFLSSDDPAFRPVQVKLGPDGALWVADFYNPIIGHYEVPLTHPARDRSHGRIWRVVWRGLDGSVAPPPLPKLAGFRPAELVSRIADPNLTVRSLAVAELLAHRDAARAVPALRNAASRLVAGADSSAAESAALPLFFALERLGQADEGLLRRALARPDSAAALAALRVLAARDSLPADAAELFSNLSKQAASGHSWRQCASLLTRHLQPWAAPILLTMLAQAPAADFELVYALRLALKTQTLSASLDQLRGWAHPSAATAARLADVCLAVPTSAAALFLLEHLAQSKFASSRAGEFARHAVKYLPSADLAAVLPLQRSLAAAPLAQRLAVAEGLAAVAAKPDVALPEELAARMRDDLLAALGDRDAALVLRAIAALKPLPVPEKIAPFRRIALDSRARETNRTAALRALPAGESDTDTVLLEVLGQPGSNVLRRTAAELLGATLATSTSPERARNALTGAFTTASADLALALATALAKSDAGAGDLLDLAAAGRVRPALLRHRHLVLAFEKRPPALRERAARLTADLPPEDARLDAVIAQRLGAVGRHRPVAARGATLFATHCASCHRFRDAGGNLGPSLDGISSRTSQRLIEDILDPSRNVDPAFRLTTITLKHGETKSGLNLRDEGARVLLTDATTGQPISVARADVTATATLPVSPMPATFETALSDAEFFDLLEYLRAPAK